MGSVIMEKRYIQFKIELAENMSKDKVVLLTHPENQIMVARSLLRLQNELENFEED